MSVSGKFFTVLGFPRIPNQSLLGGSEASGMHKEFKLLRPPSERHSGRPTETINSTPRQTTLVNKWNSVARESCVVLMFWTAPGWIFKWSEWMPIAEWKDREGGLLCASAFGLWTRVCFGEVKEQLLSVSWKNRGLWAKVCLPGPSICSHFVRRKVSCWFVCPTNPNNPRLGIWFFFIMLWFIAKQFVRHGRQTIIKRIS